MLESLHHPHFPIAPASVALVCVCAFAASILDAMVGGGGLISVPALFIVFPTAPGPMLLGTNKLASSFGAGAAVFRYSRAGQVPWKMIRWPAALSLLASIGGAACVSRVNPLVLRPLVLGLLVLVLVLTLIKKDIGGIRSEISRPAAVGLAIGLVLGFYEGFFGPGTGSFLLFLYVVLYGFSFLKASASGRVVNFAANIGALGYFLSSGLVVLEIAIPMAVCTILGGTLGSHLAITQGSRWVRFAFILVVIAVIGKFGYDLLA